VVSRHSCARREYQSPFFSSAKKPCSMSSLYAR
jgi:hypothetical protein